MLSRNEFLVLRELATATQTQPPTQRAIAERCDLSLGTVNSALKTLTAHGYCDGGFLTPAGEAAIAPYKVNNAVIMAAGLSSRFAPISYEKPKGVLSVRGEVLIERQIRQLHQVGITDIVVVVGYKKEFFFYLEEQFGVHIRVNPEYAHRNNNSSIKVVLDKLSRTYICSSDNYFAENPFSTYEYDAYYAAEYCQGKTDEWCLQLGAQDRIVGVTIGGQDSWYMLGHVFFDEPFSQRFSQILQDEYDAPQTADKLWESIYIDHIDELAMHIKRYPEGVINEFDSLLDLKKFDPYFLENVDSAAFDHIVEVLGCTKNDITDIYPLKQGLTNLSCHFRVGDKQYVYRHPGVGTEKLIDRVAEANALRIASRLGLDKTFIHADPQTGWKISEFIPNCKPFDPHNRKHAKIAMATARALHESTETIDRTFDFFQEGMRYDAILREKGPIEVPGYEAMLARVKELESYIEACTRPLCLCHNDFFELNLLIDEHDTLSLIDWEYAGMSDYANDFGTYTTCCQLSETEALDTLALYFERTPTDLEIAHNFAHVCLAGWCWYLWSLVKESEGESVGEWLYIYYRYAADYLEKSLARYKALESPSKLAAAAHASVASDDQAAADKALESPSKSKELS